MLALFLLTLLSLFATVLGLGDNHGSPVLKSFSAAAPILLVILAVFLVASPMLFVVIRRLRRGFQHTKDSLRDTQATIASLTQGHIYDAIRISALERQNARIQYANHSLFGRCMELEIIVTETEKQQNLDAQNANALSEIARLKLYIATMEAEKAHIVEDARCLKGALDEANTQRHIAHRRHQILTTEVGALTETRDHTLNDIYELESILEEKDAQLYDARRRATKVNELEGQIEELEVQNKRLRDTVCDLIIVNAQNIVTVEDLEDEKDAHIVELSITTPTTHKAPTQALGCTTYPTPITPTSPTWSETTITGTSETSGFETDSDFTDSTPTTPISPTLTLVSDTTDAKDNDDIEPIFTALPPRQSFPTRVIPLGVVSTTTTDDSKALFRSALCKHATLVDLERWKGVWGSSISMIAVATA